MLNAISANCTPLAIVEVINDLVSLCFPVAKPNTEEHGVVVTYFRSVQPEIQCASGRPWGVVPNIRLNAHFQINVTLLIGR